MTRRDLLRLLLASPLAATFDVERALWVPKPIVVVPELPEQFTQAVFTPDEVRRVFELRRTFEVTSFHDDYYSYILV